MYTRTFRHEPGGTFAGIVGLGVLVVWLLAVIGYIMNVVKLISIGMGTELANVSTEFILRLVGLFPPVGAVLGWF